MIRRIFTAGEREELLSPWGSGQKHSPLAEYQTITPPLRGLLKKSHRGSAMNFTPPLRGSHRDRAVCAKVDVVGGESRFIATPSYTPHRIAFGLTPSALRLPLKGGVKFKSACVTNLLIPSRPARAVSRDEGGRTPRAPFDPRSSIGSILRYAASPLLRMRWK